MADDDAKDRAPTQPQERPTQDKPVHERPVQERPRDPRDRDNDGLPDTLRQRLEALVPELVKKTFAAGMGAVFSTEEGIRKLARENLPDAVGYIASTADGAKDRVFEVIARETREFLSNLNVSEEIAKMLTTLSFEIKTEIRFIPNSERFTGAEPDVKASVRLKRTTEAPKDAKETPKDDDPDQRDSRSRLRFWRRDGEEGEEPDTGPEK